MPPLFVPMTKATGLGRLPDLLEQQAGSKAMPLAFQRAGLPMDIIEFSETRIPIKAMCTLFELSARAVGDRCFGLRVGFDMTHTTFGLWMKFCAQAETLMAGMNRAVICTAFQQSGGKMMLDTGAPVAFWRYIAPPGCAMQQIHHCDHLIGPMVRFVQSFLGPDWRPEWIELNYPRDASAHLLEAQLPWPVRFGTPALSLAIKHSDLAHRRKVSPDAGRIVTFGDVQAAEISGPTKEPLVSVFSAITLRLLDGQSDIDGVARLLGVGVQKLQRTLRREGVEYRDLLNRAKRQRAQALLADTSLSVIDIAFSLGYSDHANFSRAFKRMVGIAPATYRADRVLVCQSDPARMTAR